ncbi:unnamed protein product [Rotaria magnacalcarata]|uniref:Uncharacterized protein n=2 Tax=Rotaria magnacalcarata TaxID=392030 RepID=A0A816RKM5_9BILA|nr:unnamed protein product [Rotaria magnacalcarata]
MQPITNRQTEHVACLSIPSDNCIQLIAHAAIINIRYKVSQENVALLCCCLPSLVRQIMYKRPWLKPNDIITCLSSDIMKEAMDCFDDNDCLNSRNKAFDEKRVDKQLNDNDSMKSHQYDSNSLSSYQSKKQVTSDDSILSEDSSQLDLESQKNTNRKKEKKVDDSLENWKINGKKVNGKRKFSPQSLNKQRNKDIKSTILVSSTDTQNKLENSDTDSSVRTLQDGRNTKKDFDKINFKFKSKLDSRPSRHLIEYPAEKDSNISQHVEKCLAFYYKIREYFDDDTSALLLKCCLCYGNCSRKK